MICKTTSDGREPIVYERERERVRRDPACSIKQHIMSLWAPIALKCSRARSLRAGVTAEERDWTIFCGTGSLPKAEGQWFRFVCTDNRLGFAVRDGSFEPRVGSIGRAFDM
ncbi:unnamed protein product [Discosporangium mesarthrocarpum]